MIAFIVVSVDAALVPAVFGKSFILSVDCTAAIFVDGCWDVALTTSAMVSSVEAKTVDDGNTGIFVDVFVFVIAVVVAVVASTGNCAVVLDDISNDVALAFAIGRTAFVCA